MRERTFAHPSLEPALGERKSAQGFHLLRRNIFGRDQNVKTLAHPGGCYQMFELKSDFGALLRDAAVLEGVGKLIRLSNSHQELRLA